MLKLSNYCTRFATSYSSCTVLGAVKKYVAAVEPLSLPPKLMVF